MFDGIFSEEKQFKITTVILLLLALCFMVMEIFSPNYTKYIIPISLITLTTIPHSIGKVLHQTRMLDRSTAELKTKLEEMDRPDTSKVLKLFGTMKPDLVKDLQRAKRIQVLSRTGQRLHNDILNKMNDIQDKDIRLLCLDPRKGHDDSFRMYVKQNHQLSNTNILNLNLNTERAKHINFLNTLPNKIEAKVMNYLPSYSLVMIDCPIIPINNEQCEECSKAVIYCELASFNSLIYGKPVFKVTRDQTQCYNFFLKEFNDLWTKQGTNWP